ncbi:MAG: hypothetical protein QM539_01310 [Alphaproteobacteria bacterium]|nr:hypothetical protein [Alphaproteobacteria bacterium]
MLKRIPKYYLLIYIFINCLFIINCEPDVVDSGARVETLNCSGVPIVNIPIVGFNYSQNFNIPYTGGNGKEYPNSSGINSTSVTGLTAVLQSGNLVNGNGTITVTISGIASKIGNALFSVSFGGKNCLFSLPVSGTGPGKSILTYPVNNTSCLTTDTGVGFTWNNAVNTSKYKLYVTNLIDTNLKYADTTIVNYKNLMLPINQPYQWRVVSYGPTNDSAVSDVQRFYLAGAASVNYAPFPAQAVLPIEYARLLSPVSLMWTGDDPDGLNDIDYYEVWLDDRIINSKSTITTQILNNISPGPHTWFINTIDKKENKTKSNTFHFTVL